MQFDFKKEIGLDDAISTENVPSGAGKKPRLPRNKVNLLLYILAVVLILNLILLIILICTFSKDKSPDKESLAWPNKVEEVSTQMFAYSEARMSQLEISLNELKQDFENQKLANEHFPIIQKNIESHKPSKPSLADQAVEQLDNQPPTTETLDYSDSKYFDHLIDKDDSGGEVQKVIESEADQGKKDAYINTLNQKGNDWYKEALSAIDHDDDDVSSCVDNANYFFNLVISTSSDSSLVAATKAKQTKLENAVQDYADEIAENNQKTTETKPRETAVNEWLDRRRSESGIQKYEPSGFVKEYKTDWDPDPRVREERGIQPTVNQYKSDWDPDPRVREERGIKD